MCCEEAPCKTNMTEEEESERGRAERDRAVGRCFVCIELTHVTIVKSPRDTWLPFRGAPVLCVIHVVSEESTASVGVSEQTDGPFIFVGFVFPCTSDQIGSVLDGMSYPQSHQVY